MRAVDEDGQVIHYPVRVVAMTEAGATVEGLPERLQVITQGAGFVDPGQQVRTELVPPGEQNDASGLAPIETQPLPGQGAAE